MILHGHEDEVSSTGELLVLIEENRGWALYSDREAHCLSRQSLSQGNREDCETASESRAWGIVYMGDGQEGVAGCVPEQLFTNPPTARPGQEAEVC